MDFFTGFYYCMMGGSNAAGPVSTVSVMNIGTYTGRGRFRGASNWFGRGCQGHLNGGGG